MTDKNKEHKTPGQGFLTTIGYGWLRDRNSLIAIPILASLYLWIASRSIYNTDSVALVMAAQSILHGNVLLKGWVFPVDNFYFIDTALFVAISSIFGASLQSAELVATIEYTVFSATCLYLLRSGRTRLDVTELLLFGIALIPLGNSPIIWQVVFSPFHTLSIAISLWLGWAITGYGSASTYIRRGDVIRRLLSAGIVGLFVFSDPLIITVCIIPIIIIAELERYRSRGPRSMSAAALDVASIAVIILTVIGLRMLFRIDGFQTAGVDLHLATVHEMAKNAINIICDFGDYFVVLGARNWMGKILVGSVTGLALIIVPVLSLRARENGGHNEARKDAYFNGFLWLAGIIQILACLTSRQYYWALAGGNPWSSTNAARYLFPCFAFFSLLNLRILRAKLDQLQSWPLIPLCLALIVIVYHIQSLAAYALHPNDNEQWRRAVRVMRGAGLSCGYGPYWASYMFDIVSREKLRVVPVSVSSTGHIVRRVWNANKRWYSQPTCSANFIVRSIRPKAGNVTSAEIKRTFGLAAERVRANGYMIYVFKKPIRVK